MLELVVGAAVAFLCYAAGLWQGYRLAVGRAPTFVPFLPPKSERKGDEDELAEEVKIALREIEP